MNSKIRAVIFDMDGVLTNSEPLINAAAIQMFQEKGLTVQPDDFLPFVGTGEERYVGGVAEKYNFPFDAAAGKQRTYEIYLDRVADQLEAFPGVHELISTCRAAGLRLGVASSADSIKVVANLNKIQLPPESWDALVTGERVQHKKPAPDIFLLAAQRLGFMPEECVVVEDAANGIQAARTAGMRSVGIASTLPAHLLYEADVVRDNISDVTLSDLAPEHGRVP